MNFFLPKEFEIGYEKIYEKAMKKKNQPIKRALVFFSFLDLLFS